MTPSLSALLDLLQPESLEVNLFRGAVRDPGWGRLYGGLVLAQALAAAESTVPAERSVHSMHAYFLRPGDVSVPVVYQVDPIRDGRSFTTRRVVAIQHGKAILNLSASFQVAETGLSHQEAMPEVPPPEDLEPQWVLAKRIAERLPDTVRTQSTQIQPIEHRPVDPTDPTRPSRRPPSRCVWYRAVDPLPDDPRLHRRLLAWSSDAHFLTTAMQPHGVSWMTPGIQMASLDHAMWFHRDFRMDQWLLYVIDSANANGSRGHVRGRFFTRDGILVASTTQEGLMRDWRHTESPQERP